MHEPDGAEYRESNEQVDDRRREDRSRKSGCGDQVESRDQHAGGRADRVGEVENRDQPPGVAASVARHAPDEARAHERECGAEQDCLGKNQHSGERPFHDYKRDSAGERRKNCRVCERADADEDIVKNEPQQADDSFDCGVGDQRLLYPGAPACGERCADGHSAEVDDEDDDLGVGAVADEEAEVAAPDGLVDESGGAGEYENNNKQDGHDRETTVYRSFVLAGGLRCFVACS
jgi:hypothetical protein